jgi:ATP-binding cassette, subfamily B, multidrug efflux pump
MGPFRWIFQYLKKYVLQMILGFMLVIIAAAVNMVNPFLAGFIVDRVIQGGEKSLLIKLIMIMIGATVFKCIVRFSFQMIFEYISQSVLFKIRNKFYSRIQEMDFAFFDKTRTGDIMARMTGDLDAVRHFVAWVSYMLIENAMVFIFAVVMLFSTSYKLSLILLAITPIIGFITFKFVKSIKESFTQIRNQFSRLNTLVQENISGNRVVKAFAREDYEILKFSKENRAYGDKVLENAKLWEKYMPIIDSLTSSLAVVLILAGGLMIINGSITLGEFVSFNSFLWALSNPVRMSGWLLNDVQRFRASSEKVIEMVNTEPVIKNPEEITKETKVAGKIEFKNVSFSYGDELVLKDINFKVEHGQTIAVIGPTGAGKSSLINLICRFYDCTYGEILIDDNNIKDYDLIKLREKISVAMQDIFLFSDTIEGNISYGVPNASIDQIEWAASVAGAEGFIKNFPQGYDTIIGERGVGLSGGQKQRIALARALLKNPSILILDDTTSSVDIETEHEIHKTLNTFYNEKTTFVIAHRISSVKNADNIIVLDNGRIIESGSHEKLLQNKGYYYNVYMNQYGDFDNLYGEEAI